MELLNKCIFQRICIKRVLTFVFYLAGLGKRHKSGFHPIDGVTKMRCSCVIYDLIAPRNACAKGLIVWFDISVKAAYPL